MIYALEYCQKAFYLIVKQLNESSNILSLELKHSCFWFHFKVCFLHNHKTHAHIFIQIECEFPNKLNAN